MNDPWRLTVRLKSRRALQEYIRFHQIKSDYELARRAGLKPGVVGHLVKGRRDTCSLETARRLEEALGCPPGFLFEPSMSRVADTRRHGSAA